MSIKVRQLFVGVLFLFVVIGFSSETVFAIGTSSGSGYKHWQELPGLAKRWKKNCVVLQKNSPGKAQKGNINVDGTVIAVKFIGDGSLLTGINGGGNDGDDDWIIFGTDMYSNVSGNVGIGTTSPVYDLHVNKTIAGGLVVTEVRNSDSTNASSNAMLKARTETGGGDSILSLGLQGQTNWLLQADRSDSQKLKIGTTGVDTLDSGNSWLTIQTNGKVGIGTTSPEYDLHVNKTVAGGLVVTETRNSDSTNVSSNAMLKARTETGGGDSILSLGLQGQTNWLLQADRSDSQKLKIGTTGVDTLDSGSPWLTIQTNGRVGIGTTNPSYTLDVAGTIRGDNVAPSDIRLKKDIHTIENALERVSGLRGVSYKWKDKANGKGEQIGVIAQEVEKVIPEVVSEDSEGIKSVSYNKLVSVLIEAVKELKDENNELKNRILILENIK